MISACAKLIYDINKKFTIFFRYWIIYWPIRIFIYLAIYVFLIFSSERVFGFYLLEKYPNPLLRYIGSLAFDPYLKLVIAAASVAIYYGLISFFEQRPIREFGLRCSAQELAWGIFLSIGLMAAACGILAAHGDLGLSGSTEALWLHLPAAAMTAAGTSVLEEILFRAIIFRILQQAAGTGIALTLSALLFGLLHSLNSDISSMHALLIAIEAGLPLAMAYAATQRLWLPIGLHFGWDLVYGRVFGSSVPGQSFSGLVVLTPHSGVSINGSTIDLMPSVLTVLPSVALAGYLGWRAKVVGAWYPPKHHLRIDNI